MKISVGDKELYSLNDTQKKVLKNETATEKFEDEMKRLLKYILIHKYEQCLRRLKEEWDPKLVANGVKSVPTDPEAYAELVFKQPNYKDRSARDKALKS